MYLKISNYNNLVIWKIFNHPSFTCSLPPPRPSLALPSLPMVFVGVSTFSFEKVELSIALFTVLMLTVPSAAAMADNVTGRKKVVNLSSFALITY
jgi:hypothetical protein